jgi:periplasmic protein TonB
METKKTTNANLENKRNVFFQIGLVISLGVVFLAFEWKTYESTDFKLKHSIPIFDDDDIVLPPEPEEIKVEPPKPQTVELTEVEDDVATEDFNFDIEGEEHLFIDFYVERPVVIDEPQPEVDVPFIIVQDMPEFHGGEDALFKYLGDNLVYPTMAKDIGIQGTVYVGFVIEKDGRVSTVNLQRGIGGGCDEEAMRVIRSMPQWEPGKQRGIPVRVQLSIPVRFILH